MINLNILNFSIKRKTRNMPGFQTVLIILFQILKIYFCVFQLSNDIPAVGGD